MDVNGISSYSTNSTVNSTSTTSAKESTEKTSGFNDVAATYEHTSKTSTKEYTPNIDLVNQLKADAEARTSQLRSLVEEMMTKQGSTFGIANSGNGDDIWKFLAKGDFTVDEAARLKAQEEISENGYWGVNQTSERILSFAKALTGGDPSKIEEMRAAFEKGFSQATKAWGQDLPSISNDTYDAVMAGFDKWAEEGV